MIQHGWMQLNDSPAIVENILWNQESEFPLWFIEPIQSIGA
jgi:hypothetical protein